MCFIPTVCVHREGGKSLETRLTQIFLPCRNATISTSKLQYHPHICDIEDDISSEGMRRLLVVLANAYENKLPDFASDCGSFLERLESGEELSSTGPFWEVLASGLSYMEVTSVFKSGRGVQKMKIAGEDWTVVLNFGDE